MMNGEIKKQVIDMVIERAEQGVLDRRAMWLSHDGTEVIIYGGEGAALAFTWRGIVFVKGYDRVELPDDEIVAFTQATLDAAVLCSEQLDVDGRAIERLKLHQADLDAKAEEGGGA